MAISKIILNGVTQIDLTGDTVTAGAMKAGVTAHGADGTQKTGSIQTQTQATPSISVADSTGVITASATQAEGFVEAGTKSATYAMTTKAAATITPGQYDQTIQRYRWLKGTQTILGDDDLLPGNIKDGVTIFGVTGNYSGGGGGVPLESTHYVNSFSFGSDPGGNLDFYDTTYQEISAIVLTWYNPDRGTVSLVPNSIYVGPSYLEAMFSDGESPANDAILTLENGEGYVYGELTVWPEANLDNITLTVIFPISDGGGGGGGIAE